MLIVAGLLSSVLLPVAYLGFVVVVGLLVTRLERRGTRRARRFQAVALRSPGVITDVRLVSQGKGSTWYPILRFDTAEGHHIETRAMHGRLTPGGRGREVTVLYDPADPTRAALDGGPGGRYEVLAVWVVFASVIGIIALFPDLVARLMMKLL